MERKDLNSLYDEGHFKRGYSQKADLAIAEIDNLLNPNSFSSSDFEKEWERFLEVIIGEFPDISPYNLSVLEIGLASKSLRRELLIICRFMTELLPESTECQFFLGHAYLHLDDFGSAASCYRRAYEMAMQQIKKRKLEKGSGMHIDAGGYLHYLTVAECNAGHYPEALVCAAKTLRMINDHHPTSVYLAEHYKMMHMMFLQMNMEGLAEQYRLKAIEESKKRSREVQS
ncbi:MAG: hypothetical protein COY66_01340 [Candidatus Kerfeldbacteria bacterium CG_4_10_14_0_8_um_filter_42_10]|uniref:MalT-like TPR region domain-containing protein n=1 Tax=Candidatus Kerfeldbacteria bacterium CG_4_10_14_0_8_um_filter_42_10 TaxID=2014248 RepID=A0A2M7RK13_9BACT|nr:MAG: hypothetical protein COY66_01340 [Candidatus Kerfeldbacteria bacterium CG_4_10_14_0_8_um_filter_42_10]